MMFTSEKKLLKGAQAFDIPSLTAIYDQLSPGIYRYAMRLLGDDSLAEDCVAETFSRFLKTLKAGQGPQDHLQAYLYRIAHNWITDTYRRQPPLPIELDESLQTDPYSSPENEAEILMEQKKVRLALKSLTPDQQQVVTLRFIEGWENEEVAAALGKPVGAVKALQHRALNMLRRILVKDEKESLYESEG